jgi:hypothetical protein
MGLKRPPHAARNGHHVGRQGSGPTQKWRYVDKGVRQVGILWQPLDQNPAFRKNGRKLADRCTGLGRRAGLLKEHQPPTISASAMEM